MLQKTKETLEESQSKGKWWTSTKDIPVHGNEIKPKKTRHLSEQRFQLHMEKKDIVLR